MLSRGIQEKLIFPWKSRPVVDISRGFTLIRSTSTTSKYPSLRRREMCWPGRSGVTPPTTSSTSPKRCFCPWERRIQTIWRLSSNSSGTGALELKVRDPCLSGLCILPWLPSLFRWENQPAGAEWGGLSLADDAPEAGRQDLPLARGSLWVNHIW